MTYRRLLAAWLVLAVAMPLNGAFRELLLKRWLPQYPAEIISAALGIVIILAITRAIFRIPAATPSPRLAAMSALLVALTVLYEVGFGLMEGATPADLLAHYALWRGELWPIVLIVLGATPFIWRGRERS